MMKLVGYKSAFCAFLTILALIFPATSMRADPGVVSHEELIPLGELAWAAPKFEMPIPSPGLPILDLVDNSPEAVLLRRLESQGLAAGFGNVIYDNHDRGHSLPDAGTFPQLSKLYFSEELRKLNMDYGLAGRIILPAIVIGNSSTAITKGKRKRSQPRLAMTTPDGPIRAFLTYVTNHLYIYPEHRDHDAVDWFPANWPYMVITQGSSHSDKPFIRALLMAVAAMTPETQAMLDRNNLIAPTLQMILRRSQKTVYTRGTYHSGIAHPTVFWKKQLAPERMVSLASALKPDEIPPMVLLSVQEEDFGTAGLADLSETLFDTPSAIARIWRSTDYTRRMVVSAANTTDPNGHDLEFTWALLRGDPKRVRITPGGERGETAEISIDWHPTRQISPGHKRLTNRVDIGVFAWNGYHDSAPAIISIGFPGHQIREYGPVADGTQTKLLSIDYDAAERDAKYDPVLFWSAPWKDVMIYDDAGAVVEMQRQFADKTLSLASAEALSNGQEIRYSLKENEGSRILSMDAGENQ